ncbi:MAG: AtpZ/AtpI family protein [Schleiferiaceae bacterium]
MSKQPNPFIRYSGLAFQMAAPIILGVLIGRYLDGEDALLYTIIFSLLGVFSGLYLALKDFL